MKGPKTWPGAVALAIVTTAACLTIMAAMGQLIASRWLFTGNHGAIWIVVTSGLNGLVVVWLAMRKDAQDKRAMAPKTVAAAPNPRRLSGPGGVYRPRKRQT